MRYPNLAAEMAQLDNDIQRTRVADAANMTIELLQDIVHGRIDDELYASEARAIAGYFNQPLGCLFAKELSVVDPADDKDDEMLCLSLELKLLQLEGHTIFGCWDWNRLERIQALPQLIHNGESVSRAELLGSIRYIDWVYRFVTAPAPTPKRGRRCITPE